MRKFIVGKIYIALFLVVSLIPLIFFSPNSKLIGNEEAAGVPVLMDEKGLNLSFFTEADAYFSQNFGLRSQFVYAGNVYKKALYKTSGEDSAIIGEDGFLFYESALHDYIGTEVITRSQAMRAAKTVMMMRDYVAAQDKKFLFFIAPNKMSVYGEYMPYYYLPTQNSTNYDLFMEALGELKVDTVDLKKVFASKKTEGVLLYHKEDSHWNNYGAAIAFENVMGKLGLDYKSYSDLRYDVRRNFSGDLLTMLLPGSNKRDEQIYFDVEQTYEYVGNFHGSDDLVINTVNENGNGLSVILYRDSFGNALHEFFANEFSMANMRRAIPYDIASAIGDADVVVCELVERNIANLLKYPPVIISERTDASEFLETYDMCRLEFAESCMNAYEGEGQTEDGEYVKLTFSNECLDDAYLIYFTDGKSMYEIIPSGESVSGTMYMYADDYAEVLASAEKYYLLYK